MVTTVLGLNGIGLTATTAKGVLEVHDDGAGFAAAVQSLDEDDTLWAKLSSAAVAHVRENLNEASQRKVLNNILRPAMARRVFCCWACGAERVSERECVVVLRGVCCGAS